MKKKNDLYQEANEIEYHDYIPLHTSCYESLLEFEEIIVKAREMESQQETSIKSFKRLPHPACRFLRRRC